MESRKRKEGGVYKIVEEAEIRACYESATASQVGPTESKRRVYTTGTTESQQHYDAPKPHPLYQRLITPNLPRHCRRLSGTPWDCWALG